MSYPILLRLEGRTCVIVGGGKVATRKITGLLAAGATIIVISLAVDSVVAELASQGKIELLLQSYQRDHLTTLAPFVVIAATDNPTINAQVADDARKFGALVDCVDDDSNNDFTSMAAIRRGDLTIAIGTGGGSPALTMHIRQEIEALIGEEYGILLGWLSTLRDKIQQEIPGEKDRRDLWHRIIESPVLDLIRRGDETAAQTMLQTILDDTKKGKQD